MLSFVVAGLACIFAALCYAEFASMVPVAGSAYTYAYATLGELFAWIIGWDLILEYAVASATVAHGWSHYFQDFIGIFGLQLPEALAHRALRLRPRHRGSFATTGAWFDLPAIVIAGARHLGPGEGHPGERRLQHRRWWRSSWRSSSS